MNAYFIARRVYFRALLNLKTQSSIVKQKRKCKNTTTAIFLSNIWFSFFFFYLILLLWCLQVVFDVWGTSKTRKLITNGSRFFDSGCGFHLCVFACLRRMIIILTWLISVNVTSSPHFLRSTAICAAGRSFERPASDCWCWFQQNAWKANEKQQMCYWWQSIEAHEREPIKIGHKDVWVLRSNYIWACLWGAKGVCAVNSDRLSFSQMTSPNLKAQSSYRRGWSQCMSTPPTRSGRRAAAGGCFASGSKSTEWTWRPLSLTRGWSAMEVRAQLKRGHLHCQENSWNHLETSPRRQNFRKSMTEAVCFRPVSFLIMTKY